MANTIQIAILEDHPVFRTGIKLSLAPVYHVALEAETAAEFFQKIKTARINLLILDISLPDKSVVEVTRQMRQQYPHIKILVLSADGHEETLPQLMEIGIDGFINKNVSDKQLLEAVKSISKGKFYHSQPDGVLEHDIINSNRSTRHDSLTPREYDIMLALCKGLSCLEIADLMFVSPKTVDNHKQHIFAKLGIHNNVQLVTYAVRNKIIVLS